MNVDSNMNLYAIGYYDNKLYKFNKNGKVLWKRTFSNKAYWPYKIKIKGDKVTVMFGSNDSSETVSSKNGR